MFRSIVLKFTTVSEQNPQDPSSYSLPSSFYIDQKVTKIGRNPNQNEVAVPSDVRLASERHAIIEYFKGSFYLSDCGQLFAASIRIGVTQPGSSSSQKKFYLEKDCRFSVGASIFLVKEVTNDTLYLVSLEGPLANTEPIAVGINGALLGRSSDNTIAIPDRELSRRHSSIFYDQESKKFCLTDLGSTNGTYIQLVGPIYGGKYRLQLNDHILVGRTGFSVNRFDYGCSEVMGFRQTMEDASVSIQHLNVPQYCDFLTPQSFFGVFDGHGGAAASHFLQNNLHINIARALRDVSPELVEVIEVASNPPVYPPGQEPPASSAVNYSNNSMRKNGTLRGQFPPPSNILEHPQAVQLLDSIITKTLVTTFINTDNIFINKSPTPQHGSTATTALILGNRLYCANTGDSRTMICRNFKPVWLSTDHKPDLPSEHNRIKEAGGFVFKSRLMGELAVSRAFGDIDYKKGVQGLIDVESGTNRAGNSVCPPRPNGEEKLDKPLLTAEPDVKAITLTPDDQFLLLGCDGLFDVCSDEFIVQFVRDRMSHHGDPTRCSQELTREAIKKHSRDNVTVVLVILNKWY